MEAGISRTRLDPAPAERFVALRRQLGVSSFGMNQITLPPGGRGRIHLHLNQEEVFLVLDGVLTLIVEGEAHDLGQGDLMRVAPNLKRQLVNLGPGPVTMLALGGDGEHHGRDGQAFTAWDQLTGAPPQEIPLPDDLGAAELRT